MIIEVKICFYDLQYKLLTNLGNYIACVLTKRDTTDEKDAKEVSIEKT